MSVSNRDRIIAINNCLKNIAIVTQRLPDEPNYEAKNTIGQELHMAINLLEDVRKTGELTEEFHAQLLQQLGATNQVQAGEIIGELQSGIQLDIPGATLKLDGETFTMTEVRDALANKTTKINASWSLHDRVEFGLRDAGFSLDEAAFVAEMAGAYEETKNSPRYDRIVAIMQANGFPDDEAKHIGEGGAIIASMLKILDRIKLRMHFIEIPSEPMWNPTGNKWVPDWRYEIQLIEYMLHARPVTAAEKPTDTKRRDAVS